MIIEVFCRVVDVRVSVNGRVASLSAVQMNMAIVFFAVAATFIAA